MLFKYMQWCFFSFWIHDFHIYMTFINSTQLHTYFEEEDPLQAGKAYGRSGSVLEDCILHISHTHPLFWGDNATVYGQEQARVPEALLVRWQGNYFRGHGHGKDHEANVHSQGVKSALPWSRMSRSHIKLSVSSVQVYKVNTVVETVKGKDHGVIVKG